MKNLNLINQQISIYDPYKPQICRVIEETKGFFMNKFAILFGLSFILPCKVIAVTGGGDQGAPAYESWQGLIIKDENCCYPEVKLQA